MKRGTLIVGLFLVGLLVLTGCASDEVVRIPSVDTSECDHIPDGTISVMGDMKEACIADVLDDTSYCDNLFINWKVNFEHYNARSWCYASILEDTSYCELMSHQDFTDACYMCPDCGSIVSDSDIVDKIKGDN